MNEEQAAAGALLGAVAGVGGAVGAAVGSLFAAEGALNKMLSGAQGSAQKFSVSKETVLQAGKIISDQRVILENAYASAVRELAVELTDSSDFVSSDIAGAWNSRLVEGPSSYGGRVEQYIESLKGLSEKLRTTAEQYGFTEDEVMASFGPKE